MHYLRTDLGYLLIADFRYRLIRQLLIFARLLRTGLQQLQRSTEPSYADFACIGRSLSRLGEFLSQLNNSIECSVAAASAALATSPPSPKPRRRFQFSFRSSALDVSESASMPPPPAVRDPLRKYDFLCHFSFLNISNHLSISFFVNSVCVCALPLDCMYTLCCISSGCHVCDVLITYLTVMR